MEILFVPLALLAGALLTVQVDANTQLSKGAGGPFAATTLQLGFGAVVLILLAALLDTLGAVGPLPEVTWWHAFGGLASVFYAGQSTETPRKKTGEAQRTALRSGKTLPNHEEDRLEPEYGSDRKIR